MDWQVNTPYNKPSGLVAIWIPTRSDWYKALWYDYAGEFWMSPGYRRLAEDNEVSHWAYIEMPE